MIDHLGNVTACQMLIGERWADIANDDPLGAVREKGSALFDPPSDESPECRSCPWRYVCSGGCPLIRETPLHRRYCQVYRAILPQLVRLEGLKLILQA